MRLGRGVGDWRGHSEFGGCGGRERGRMGVVRSNSDCGSQGPGSPAHQRSPVPGTRWWRLVSGGMTPFLGKK